MSATGVGGRVFAIAVTSLSAVNALALEKRPIATLDLAKKMTAACEAKAQQQGWKMNIAIVDNGANLVAFERMDGAFLGSIYVAQHKAITSVDFPVASRSIAEAAYGKDQQPPRAPGLASIPGIVLVPGGLPIITADKTLIGAIGVSGSTSDNVACAESRCQSDRCSPKPQFRWCRGEATAKVASFPVDC